ncbi:hypothetical protein ACFV6E_04880 [Streptomyces sp. NPDC059785]|uniref:hypothetical protein n=1 Tax=unclassified Streptomyces TaxID=2593676 RepID=UPI0036486C23
MAIIMTPQARVTARAAGGRVLSTVRASTPTPGWTTAQAVMCSAPSSPVRAATGRPPAGRTNCGNQRLYDDHLARLPGAQRLTSTLVVKYVVQDRPLPE